MAHLGIHKVTLISGFGAILLLLGIFFGWYGFPYMFKKNVNKRISLFPGSEAMQRWMNVPFPLEFKVYFFNVTNADDVHIGERPKLQEVGPYIFDLYKSKVNVSYDKVNDTLIYYNKDRYYFNAKKSHPFKENDILTLINVPLVGTATMVEKMFPMGLSFLDRAMPFLFPNITTMFLTGTAKQFMFDGIFINCSYATGPAMPVCNGLRGRLPATIVPIPNTKNFKFSFFKHKNDSAVGPFKIFGGNRDIYKLGEIIEFKSNHSLSMWPADTTCSDIRGSDSSVFPPITNLNQDLYIYIPDMCLSLSAVYSNTSVINDITVYRYESSEDNFADSSTVPENICRCSKSDDQKLLCLKEGVIDASNCQGAPVIFSQPHLLDADPEYTDYPEGLNPDRDRHLTYVLLEPKTGVPVVGWKRMQMNIFLRRIPDISLLANVSQGLFPISWVEEGGEINEESFKKLSEMYAIYNSLDLAKWIIIACGICLLLISSIMFAKNKMLLCFNSNRVSEFSYGVNTFHVESKTNHELQSKSTGFNNTNSRDDVIQTISGRLYPESKIHENVPISVLPS
ncbi:hypothetical protein O3M35_007005 [Rhynocoris fuscipes]|uniref:Sensory neuron membrane protein 2 n=1 Tax=Rhynocoris fuscipes TaxID=488301 RepID=A0AAW1DGW9_9HEMI